MGAWILEGRPVPHDIRDKPTLSVVVPLYQSCATIEATLASLVAQDFHDIEIIVVDDGSTDAGPELVRMARSVDERIRLVSQPNRGLAGARNAGIRAARAEIVGFCDADDTWERGKASAHLSLLAAWPSTGLSFSGSRILSEDGSPTGVVRLAPDGLVDADDMILRNPVGNGSSAVVRRSCIDSVAFTGPDGTRQWFDESYRQCEDIELWMRIALSPWESRGIPTPLVGYRVGGASLSSNLARQAEAWDRMLTALQASNPDVAARSGIPARANMLAWLARKAILSLDGRQAAGYLAKALSSHPRLLVADPVRTTLGIISALLLLVVPTALARRLRTVGIKAFARVKAPPHRRTQGVRPAPSGHTLDPAPRLNAETA
jgi:GT2 family glycosyltransferase